MFDILFNPTKSIDKAKKGNIGKTFLILLVASLFVALSVLFTSGFSLWSVIIAAVSLVSVFAITMFLAVLLQFTMHILSKKGGYYEALTTLTYGFFVLSCGVFLSSVITLIPKTTAVLAIIVTSISGIAMLFAFICANAVVLRAALVLFKTDLLTVVVALTIIYFGTLLVLYLISLI